MKILFENWRRYLIKEDVIDAEFRFLQERAKRLGFMLSIEKAPTGLYKARFWYFGVAGIEAPIPEEYLRWFDKSVDDSDRFQTGFASILTLSSRSYEEIIWKIKHNLEHALEPKYGKEPEGVDLHIDDPNNVVPLSRQED